MRRSVRLILFAATAASALSACSKAENWRSDDARVARVADAETSGPATTSARGVAFNYAYRFVVQNDRISGLQESHAQACEALGAARCRITGMRYDADEDRITASLDLKLDPAIARKFGTQSVEATKKAGGKLGGARISGTDAGGAIAAIDETTARRKSELARIEEQLAALPAGARDRKALRDKAEAIRESISQNDTIRDTHVAELATTPMHFDYGAIETFAGVDAQSTLGNALSIGYQSFLGAVTLLAIVIAGGLPWALLALVGLLLYRRFRPRPIEF